MKTPIVRAEEQRSHLENALNSLPKLPQIVRYPDDFDGKLYTLKNYRNNNKFQFVISGSRVTFNFNEFKKCQQHLTKYLLFNWISLDFSISTVYIYLVALRNLNPDYLMNLILAGPERIKQEWAKLFAIEGLSTATYSAIRAMLVFLARYSLAGWSPLYLDFISTTLPAPFKDKYAGVRSGDVFLSAEEEALIVNYLEDISTQIKQVPENVVTAQLEPACMLLCSYLFGMRPIQIAMLSLRDIRIWPKSTTEYPSVHLSFRMVKQRRKSKILPLIRRVKYEWAPMIIELYQRVVSQGSSGGDRLFKVESAWAAGKTIQNLASSIVGCNVTATDLRHTAAQRLVDAGASQEEVAEFLGHTDITTCLVYYASSPCQAERVNQALGISAIYQQVTKIAHAGFISAEELAQLKGSRQIAGVPHGIPITGIGGCASGQPSCPYNPITSCYGCSKFMPVMDINLHRQVLEDMRSVVKLFANSSREDGSSPAFLQLKRTITSIQSVIEELEDRNA